MRIGVDLCYLEPDYTGGLSSFSLGLVHGLEAIRAPGDRLLLFVVPRNEAYLRKQFAGHDVEFVPLPLGEMGWRLDAVTVLASWLLGNFKLRYWYDRLFRASIMNRMDGAADVILAPMMLLRFFAAKAPALVSMHDIQQEYHPEFFTLRQRIARWAPYRLTAWRATRIQASSRYIAGCLREKLSFIAPSKIVVIPESVDRERFSPDACVERPPEIAEVSAPFVFYPAQIWPHKNHLLLMEALARYREHTGEEVACVLTGRDYGGWRRIREKVEALGLRQVHYLGQVSFPRLLWLYRNCAAVLALGMHESSSLPVREGAVFGKVLIALDIPPNRETGEHLKILLVNDTASLAESFASLSNPAVIEAGRQNAELVSCFDGRRIAGEYYRVLRTMVQAGA
jgi:glycosyltransferase involved in cell wall biosynthesis